MRRRLHGFSSRRDSKGTASRAPTVTGAADFALLYPPYTSGRAEGFWSLRPQLPKSLFGKEGLRELRGPGRLNTVKRLPCLLVTERENGSQ